jgi:hypothetical protein
MNSETTVEETTAAIVATVRTIEMKQKTAIDTRAWLQGIFEQQPEEDVACLISVLTGLIEDYQRVIDRKKLDEHLFYARRNDFALACLLLEEHLTECADALTGFDYSMVPATAEQLIFVVLNDAVDQFAQSMHTGRMKNYQPLTDEELSAVVSLL